MQNSFPFHPVIIQNQLETGRRRSEYMLAEIFLLERNAGLK